MTPLVLLLAACIHFPRSPDIVCRHPAEPETVLIRDVQVIAPSGLEGHRDVRLADGLITDVSPTGSHLAADLVIDGTGRTLMPGLVDIHVHLALSAGPPWFLALPDPEHSAQSMVYAGITTVLDVGGDPAVLKRLQRSIAAGRWVGPRIYFAGQGLTVEDAYPLNMTRELYGALAHRSVEGHHYVAVQGVSDIEARVDAQADAGATFIKLVVASIPPSEPPAPRLSDDEIAAAIRRAHARGLRVAAHIDTAADALLCARLGVDLLAHGVETSRLTEEDVVALRDSGISFSPTLVNWRRFDDLTQFAFHPTTLEVATQAPATLARFATEELRSHRAVLEDSSFSSWGDALTLHRADRVANTVAMVEAGIPLLVGSDAQGSIGTFPGALHDELRLLVEAGIPTPAVLQRATRGNALFLDENANFGVIEPGRAADLLLVEGNPLEDIRATEAIVQVWVGGVPVR